MVPVRTDPSRDTLGALERLGRVEGKVVDSQTSSKVSVISVCVVVHVSLGVGWSRTSDDGVT